MWKKKRTRLYCRGKFHEDEIVLSFYYEDYCEYGLSYDWKVYYYDDSYVIACSRLMSMHL